MNSLISGQQPERGGRRHARGPKPEADHDAHRGHADDLRAQPQAERRADVEQRVLERGALRGRREEQEAALVNLRIGGEEQRADDEDDRVEQQLATAGDESADIPGDPRPGECGLDRLDDPRADGGLRQVGGQEFDQRGQLDDEGVDLRRELDAE